MNKRSHYPQFLLNFAIACLLGSTVAQSATAAGLTWGANTDNDWFTNTNWTPTTVPTNSDSAYINNGTVANIDTTGARAGNVIIGAADGDSGILNITAGDTWTDNTSIIIGNGGSGILNINSGAQVTTGQVFIAGSATGDGIVNVDGAGTTWDNNASIMVGLNGSGILNISDGGTVNIFNNSVELATNSGSVGTLNIGAVSPAGILSAASVNGGAGTATLNFIHTDSNYYFTDDGTSGGTAVLITGSTVVKQVGTGTTVLTGANTYTGGTEINNGILSISNDNNLGNTSGGISFDGGTLQTTANISTTRSMTLNAGGGTFFTDNSTLFRILGSISGTGDFTKDGMGNLVFQTNTNSYTGNTNIVAGTLALNGNNTIADTGAVNISAAGTLFVNNIETIGALSGAGTVNLNRALTAGDATNTTFSGVIEGGSSFTKQGSGTLTLTGTNTYTGGTIISAGTLQIGDGGTTGSITGNVTNNSALVFNRSNAVTFGGIISGTGSVTQSGGGTLTLTSSNSYTGGTTISAGTLQIGDGGTTGSITGNVTNNSALVFNRSDSVTYSNSISGTGTLTQSGSGILILSGANTYTGTTGVTAGTLTLQNGNAIADTAAVDVSAAGTFDIDNTETIGALSGAGIVNLDAGLTAGDATNTTFSGGIQGTGSFTKQGTGTLILTGTNTYNGGTTVSDGVLQGNTNSLQGDIVNNASLAFDQASDGTFSDVISGTGTVTKSNAGNLIFSGANTYSGATTIDGGILSVNGSIANSNVTVNAGGTLGGNGTVGSVTLNGGTFAPGNSIGTTHVSGNVDFSGGGVYQVEVDDAGNSDQIIASGTATLTGGSVEILPQAGTYNLVTDYTILTANGGLNGTFDSNTIDSSFAFLTPTLSYDTNNVYLELLRNNVSFSAIAATPNQKAIANWLTKLSVTNPTAAQDIINQLLLLTSKGAEQAFDSLSGVQTSHYEQLILRLNQQFLHVLFNRINFSGGGGLASLDVTQGPLYAYNGNDWSMLAGAAVTGSDGFMHPPRGWWMRGFGGVGSVDNTTNVLGMNYRSGGFAAGIDTDWNDTTVGLALGYTKTGADTFGGNLDVDSYQLAGYGGWERDALYLNGEVDFGYHRTGSERLVTVGALSGVATGDYNGYNVGTTLEAGKHFNISDATTVTPFIGLSYQHSNRDGFTETGAGALNLAVKSDSQDSLRTSIGVQVATTVTHNQTELTPYASVAYARENLDSTSTLQAGLSSVPNTTFQVDGTKLDRNRLQINAGFTGKISDSTSFNVGYAGEIAGSDESHGVSATLRFVW